MTVAIVIAVGTLIGAARWFGGQRTWVPLAALFLLTVKGTSPDTYAVGYLTQVALGAVVGLVANTVLFPPLPLREVDRAVAPGAQVARQPAAPGPVGGGRCRTT